jgi:hypothetical protein
MGLSFPDMSPCLHSHFSSRSVQKRMATHDKDRRRIRVAGQLCSPPREAGDEVDERKLADLKLFRNMLLIERTDIPTIAGREIRVVGTVSPAPISAADSSTGR